jgi:hypothetical protein
MSRGRFVVLIAVALFVGRWLSLKLYVLLAALFGYSMYSLTTLYQLQTWLRSRRRHAPPEARGV